MKPAKVQVASPAKNRNNTFFRDILPLLAFSAKASLPVALQVPTQLVAFICSLYHLGVDLRQLVTDIYRNFISNGQSRHLREGLSNFILNSIQIYLSTVSAVALCWYNGGLQSVFTTEITEFIQKTVIQGANLCKSGVTMCFHYFRKTLQNGKLSFIDEWIKYNRIFIAFSLLLTNITHLNVHLSVLIQPLAVVYAATAIYMILDTLHNIIFESKEDAQNDPIITDTIHVLNSLSWLSMLTIAIDCIYPLTNIYIPFQPGKSEILRTISAFSTITTEILTECFCPAPAAALAQSPKASKQMLKASKNQTNHEPSSEQTTTPQATWGMSL